MQRPSSFIFVLLLAASTGSVVAAKPADDLPWIARLSYGANTEEVAAVRSKGRSRYLAQQLAAPSIDLPPAVADAVGRLDTTRADPKSTLAAINAENKRINGLPDGADKEQARKALNEQGNRYAYEATRRHLLRAIYGRDQLQEQLVWFWLNHFSVFQYKGNVRWLVADYEERAIRPHALGKFRELVLATLAHPAMLQYLDNAQNAAGHLNENYARELMELHTLGVNNGYSQADVQELARILTGVGINAGDAPKLRKEWQPLYKSDGAFEFNPARHDFEPKMLLGQKITGNGFGEVEQAVDLLTRQAGCAHFISFKLAQYFVADDPPPKLVAAMAKTFQHTDGNIAAVLKTLFDSKEFAASLGTKFRDPMHYVVGAVRSAYGGEVIANTHPIVNWLNALGEPLYGRQSPDGYPLTEAGWASSGQISRRFEIARSIASGNSGLFEPEDGSPATTTGFPQLANRLYYEDVEATLSDRTRAALARASSQVEWNTFLLASPEFNYR